MEIEYYPILPDEPVLIKAPFDPARSSRIDGGALSADAELLLNPFVGSRKQFASFADSDTAVQKAIRSTSK